MQPVFGARDRAHRGADARLHTSGTSEQLGIKQFTGGRNVTVASFPVSRAATL